MKINTKFTLIMLFLALLAAGARAQDPVEILRKSEEIRRGVESSHAEVKMTIQRPDWKREMSLKMWSKGDTYALILVTAPARDKGMATLKRDQEVWNFMPNINRTIKLSRSMMSQSWMGSDFTNNDLVQEVSVIDDYDHRILKDSVLEGRKCWKIELVPHEDVAVVWGKVHMFVDQEDYLQLRTEFFDEDGVLVNVMKGTNIKVMDGHTVASRMEMIPVEEEGKKTILEYQSLSFNEEVGEDFFSVQNMKRVR